LRTRIAGVKPLSLHFLACGFDENGDGHILVIDGETPVGHYDKTGMFAIGSGAHAALSALAFHADAHLLSQYSEVKESVYCALEARFMAATAEDVGKESTFITVMEKDKKIQYMSDPGIDVIRNIWKRRGAPRIPPQAIEMIPKLLHTMEEPKTAEEEIHRIEAMIGKPGLGKRLFAKRKQAAER
jgi:hypothetical protein